MLWTVPSRFARFTPRSGPVTACALGLIALQLIIRQSFVRDSYWWQDDFGHLLLAGQSNLSVDFLVRDYNDHLEILPNLVYWAISRSQHPSFEWAVLVVLGLQLVASLLMYLLLEELVGKRPVVLVALAVYLFSPLMLVASTWFAASLEALPLQVALLGATWTMLRFTRGGRIPWLLASLAFNAFGLAAWEKSVLVLPAVIGVHNVLLSVGQPIRTRVALLRERWWGWGLQLVLVAGYLWLYANVVDGSERTAVQSGDSLDAAGLLEGVPPWAHRRSVDCPWGREHDLSRALGCSHRAGHRRGRRTGGGLSHTWGSACPGPTHLRRCLSRRGCRADALGPGAVSRAGRG